jgi:alkanesulfonate monooxygenase SsuD/methylene tetrahydromethanopterin reductase-like flavin-dependent oxidoreductase (luciferase family)
MILYVWKLDHLLMRYGINVPNFGDYFHPNTLADLAVEAEKAGWDGFFVWDHLTGYGDVCDTTIALATIAVRTEHIRFGAMITPLPRRRPWKVAREMISLDHLSDGRLVVGVGLGNPPSEFESFGEDVNAKLRAQKLDDGLNILLGLWSGKPFSYYSTHYQLDGVEYIPRPVQRPRIPIWVGGFWPNKKPMRRAARYDGVYPLRIWPSRPRRQDGTASSYGTISQDTRARPLIQLRVARRLSLG